MTTFTSQQSGNWNDFSGNGTSPWFDGGVQTALNAVPVTGDTVVLADGFTVTIPVGFVASCGTSPADDTGTPAIQNSSNTGTGILIVNGTLRFRGPIRQAKTGWVVNAGATLEHNSANAAVPATANYTWKIGMVDSTPSHLSIAGTGPGANRVTLMKGVGSGNAGGFLYGGASGQSCGQVWCTYATITDWGTSAKWLCRTFLNASGDKTYFDNTTIDRCGPIATLKVVDGCDWRLKNTSYRSPLASVSWYTDGAGSGLSISPSTGDRRLENVYIEGKVSLFNSASTDAQGGMHFVNVVLAGTTTFTPINAISGMQCAEWTNVVLYNRVQATGSAMQVPSGTISRSVFLRINGGLGNPHWVDAIKANTTFDTFFAESGDALSATGDGDLFQPEPRNGVRKVVNYYRGVLLPTNGFAPGTFVNSTFAGTDNGGTVQFTQGNIEHCVYPGDDSTVTASIGGENNTGVPGSAGGLFPSIQSNLVYRTTNGAGRVTKWHNSSTPQAGTYGTCGHNGLWNLTGEVYHRVGVAPLTYQVTPGTGDVVANPNFVDPTRRLLTWAQSIDPTVANWADVLNRFSKKNDDVGAVAGFTEAACLDWVLAGWASTNVLHKNTAHDGTDIGAMPAVIAGSGGVSLTALPVAARQPPQWLNAGVVALRTDPAGTLLLDPTTSARLTKRTSTTVPAAKGSGYAHPYSSGGYLTSFVWGTNQYTLYYFKNVSGAGYVQDVQLGTTTASAARSTPWSSDLRYSFSPVSGEQHIAYYFATNKLVRYDTTSGVMAEAANAVFPAGGKDFSATCVGQQQYIQIDRAGRYFVWMNGAGTAIYWWDSQTDTLRELTKTQLDAMGLTGGIDEPHFDRDTAGRFVLIKLLTYTNIAGEYKNTVLWDAQTDTVSGLVFGASHPDCGRGLSSGVEPNVGSQVRFLPAAMVGGRAVSPVASGSAGTRTFYLSDSQFGAGETHTSGQWDQGAIGTAQYLIQSVEAPSYNRTPASWTLDSGSVYKGTVSYAYQQATTGVFDVLEYNSAGTMISSRLVRATSRATMIIGSWFISGTTLYVWRTDSALPDGTTHQIAALIPHKFADGIGYFKLDGTDIRLLCHHYSLNPTTDYYSSPRATQSPDGKLIVFTSNLGLSLGPLFVLTAEAPTSVVPVPSALAITQQPGNGTSGSALTTQPVVEFRDQFGAPITSSATVTAVAVSGLVVVSAGGSKAAVGGVATFTSLALSCVATSSTPITFSAPGVTPITSSSVTVTVPVVPSNTPASLVITRAPGGSIVTGKPFPIQPIVEAKNASGQTMLTFVGFITAYITSGTGTLKGHVRVQCVGGVARFTDLAIAGSGTDVLAFTDGTPPVTAVIGVGP